MINIISGIQAMNKIPVSVVIPNFNRANELYRCLNSLTKQTFKDFEVLICDDGSTDQSYNVAEYFSSKLNLKFLNDVNFGGPARPRNRGLARSSAPLIAFLDSDDWWTPNKLSNSLAAIEKGADFVYHDLYIVRSNDQSNFVEKIQSSMPRYPIFEMMLCSSFIIPNSSVVVRKELLELIGGICEDRNLISVEDFDTWLRISHHTNRFKRLETCDGYYWLGGGNISKPTRLQEERILKLYDRHLSNLKPAYIKKAEGFLSYRIARISFQYGNFTKAKYKFIQALFSYIPLKYQLKSIYFILKILFGKTS